MQHFIKAAFACVLLAPFAANAAPQKKPEQSVDLSSYLSEMAQSPKYSKAYRSMATLPGWVSTGQGTSTPTTPQIIAGKTYRVGHLCEPHNCAQNQFDVILSEDGKQTWGLFSSRIGQKLYQMPFGNPNDAMLAALNAAYKANNPNDSQ